MSLVWLKAVDRKMRRTSVFSIVSILISASILTIPLSTYTVESSADLVIVEWYGQNRVTFGAILSEDDSETNPHYKLLRYEWSNTADYYINPSNRYGFTISAVESDIKASADEWDDETSFDVFSYAGTTSMSAGRRDYRNVVSWGSYRSGVIAVTYIWYRGAQILETDTRMNTYYRWSLSGEAGKMDVQNIMTHEFGHWAGLADLYNSGDRWLTMYGYASYGETYKQTLGWGDIKGLLAVYGS